MNELGQNQVVGASSTPANTAGTLAHSAEDRTIVAEQKLNKLRNDVGVLSVNHKALSADLEKEKDLIASLEKKIAPTLDREQRVLALIKEVSGKERLAKDIAERRSHEAERWKLIEEWYAVEQEKWVTQEDLEGQKARLAENKEKLAFLITTEEMLRREIAATEIEIEKEKLQTALNGAVVERANTEKRLADLHDARGKILAQLEMIGAKESTIEKKESEVEELLRGARSLSDERELTEKRYALERERHEIESSRWGIEDEMTRIGGSTVDSEKALAALKTKEAEITQKLAELETRVAALLQEKKPQQ